jgi:hypothetical protein
MSSPPVGSEVIPVRTYAYDPKDQSYPQPAKRNILWRYMDFTKFVSMLSSQGLYFARGDNLGDRFEGSLTAGHIARRAETEQRMKKRGSIKAHALSQDMAKARIERTIVNCWHMNEVESMAMWKLYLTTSEGIAIRSTFGRLTSAFPQFEEAHQGRTARDGLIRIQIAKVRYVTFDDPEISKGPLIMLKRKSFEHEREIRAIAVDDALELWPENPSPFPAGGEVVKVNLNALIEQVYVAPEAPVWFKTLVEDVIRAYGFTFPVTKSDLDRDPVY